jgi:hypothetical protein
VQRAKDIMPRQGSKLPWKVLMHYEKDSKMLLDDPVGDGVLRFAQADEAITELGARLRVHTTTGKVPVK